MHEITNMAVAEQNKRFQHLWHLSNTNSVKALKRLLSVWICVWPMQTNMFDVRRLTLNLQ